MTHAARSGPSGDAYLALLSGLLLGYAMMGKGFAYLPILSWAPPLGLPPFYIGEIALLTGIVIFWRTRCLAGVLTTVPALLLAAAMVWVLLRTLPFINTYGFDALRDSVVIMYGGFAFIVAALLLEDARRINKIFQYYCTFLNIYVPAVPFIFVVSWFVGDYLPKMPATDVSLLLIEPGEVAAHLVGAVVFTLVGFRKLTRFQLVSLLVSAVMVGAVSRGAMLAELIPIAFAALLLGKWRQMALTVLAGLVVFSLAYAVEPVFFDYVEASTSQERPISTRQVVDNVLSIAGQGGEQTEATKEWRVEWWNIIIAYTVFGPNFWTGRGFGLNLAMADGFSNWTVRSDHPPLRAPHNVHITLLARAGVPGVILWFGILLSWLGMMTHAVLTARRRGQTEWTGVFLLTSCYIESVVINATFDPALEAPMQGVWFWCMVGLGIGSVMVYRAQHMDLRTSSRITPNRDR
jgi:hypothetical protein